MTTTHTHDPAGTALPEPPPLPIAVLVTGTAELLRQAADLPQPRLIFIYDGQAVSLQLAPEQASAQAVARWAHRFGGVIASEPIQAEDGPRMYHRVDFDYCGIAVTVYAFIPAAPASI